jgi:peptidoglycan biosynthesis protein MviN/MurJ (putative lipid II flippase)
MKSRRQEVIARALSLFLLVALLGFALVVILLPGIIINTLRGRYQDRPNHILRASLADWQTWAIALPITAIIIATLRLAGVFGAAAPADEGNSRPIMSTTASVHPDDEIAHKLVWGKDSGQIDTACEIAKVRRGFRS